MTIYLPIAEMSVNVWVLFAMGAGVGFLSGMFGVGGGFLMTPLLIFYGITPAVAVATEANQIVASSFSGLLVHLRRAAVDFKLGGLLLIGGITGSAIGITLFSALRSVGQLDLIISLLYVVFLGTIGVLMLIESLRAIARARGVTSGRVTAPRSTPEPSGFIHSLPFKTTFKQSKLYISVIPILVLGALVGILAAIMGVGGGFIMVPAMIYLLRVPTNVVIGTSLFQIMFVTAFTTIAQSAANQTVDIVLALVLMVGGVIGAQFGARAGAKLKGEQLRALLAIMVLGVGLRLLWDLVATPDELFSIGPEGGH